MAGSTSAMRRSAASIISSGVTSRRLRQATASIAVIRMRASDVWAMLGPGSHPRTCCGGYRCAGSACTNPGPMGNCNLLDVAHASRGVREVASHALPQRRGRAMAGAAGGRRKFSPIIAHRGPNAARCGMAGTERDQPAPQGRCANVANPRKRRCKDEPRGSGSPPLFRTPPGWWSTGSADILLAANERARRGGC